MESLSANEAKTHFGDLLLKVQREPVQIKRNGKIVAIVMSVEEYSNLETLKIQQLKARVEQAKQDIIVDRTVDRNTFFNKLLAGEFD